MEGERRELTFDASPNGNFMTISVKDTGIGIEKKDLGKLFERRYSKK